MSNDHIIPPSDPHIGERIGSEFILEEQLGMGGMGVVYRATQDITQRPVAIKMMHRHVVGETLLKRFQQEAQIIAKLNHPNIVTIYKYGQHDNGSLFIAMEYVDGDDLADAIMVDGRFSIRRALPLMLQMADALAFAHEHKIIHRDIKPANMVLSRRGRSEQIKILDFGIAKILDDNYVITQTGTLVGSPGFMPPEQWKQLRDIDGRADIYSLGCVFFNMLTGQLPFKSNSTVGFMSAHLNDTPPRPLDVTPELANLPMISDIVSKCIARDRNDRFQDAYALFEALKEAERRLDSKRRRTNNPGAPPSVEDMAAPTLHLVPKRAAQVGVSQHTDPSMHSSALDELGDMLADLDHDDVDIFVEFDEDEEEPLSPRESTTNRKLVAAARAKSRSKSNTTLGARSSDPTIKPGDSLSMHRILVMIGVFEITLMLIAIAVYWSQSTPPDEASSPRGEDKGGASASE